MSDLDNIWVVDDRRGMVTYNPKEVLKPLPVRLRRALLADLARLRKYDAQVQDCKAKKEKCPECGGQGPLCLGCGRCGACC